MGVGLWLSASTARSLAEGGRLERFATWLAEVGLVPFTLNGFPYGDFHQKVVKHRVYEPRWDEPARLDYTRRLITILHTLLRAEVPGSISTLPIAWSHPPPDAGRRRATITHLRAIADELSRLESETGRLVTLCLEPEPGCLLETSQQLVHFFEEALLAGDGLLPAGNEDRIRRYLRVCHDICHAAVMFEPQAEVLQRYRQAGIEVGKVQVSSAVVVKLADRPREEQAVALGELAAFAEDRYLHQTSIRPSKTATDQSQRFFEDLPAALQAAGVTLRSGDPLPEKSSPGHVLPGIRRFVEELLGEWRVHFHVPVYLESFGHLATSQAEILQCLEAVDRFSAVSHFEVETYAWGVLPEDLRQPNLAAGIAEELKWFQALCEQRDAQDP